MDVDRLREIVKDIRNNLFKIEKMVDKEDQILSKLEDMIDDEYLHKYDENKIDAIINELRRELVDDTQFNEKVKQFMDNIEKIIDMDKVSEVHIDFPLKSIIIYCNCDDIDDWLIVASKVRKELQRIGLGYLKGHIMIKQSVNKNG